MEKEFNRVEDLKQLKTDRELNDKCNKIIDSLKGFTKNEKFRILTTLYDSFMDICEIEGISFIEYPDSNFRFKQLRIKNDKI